METLVFLILRHPPIHKKHPTPQPTNNGGENPSSSHPLSEDSSANSSANSNPSFPNPSAQQASNKLALVHPFTPLSQRQRLVSRCFTIGAKPIPALFDSTLRGFAIPYIPQSISLAWRIRNSGTAKANDRQPETNQPQPSNPKAPFSVPFPLSSQKTAPQSSSRRQNH